ncbi:hypothetical protein KIPB_010227 [Kipferlia bialata]|uniref:Uncharacterized protein n=1 Tax=Kipferlia bialata TaxID=797122 RepID=A0A9K3D2V8_9EUKA|nr:hypothetical protein KIPB_010227 [Kipferlia bialata]|eukprot:g10227.t1
MMSNKLGVASGEALARYLASPSCCLTDSALSNNRLGDKGGIAIATGLQHNSTLQRLSLARNGLGYRAAQAFFRLAANVQSGIETLNLQYNSIGDGQQKDIAHQLENTRALRLSQQQVRQESEASRMQRQEAELEAELHQLGALNTPTTAPVRREPEREREPRQGRESQPRERGEMSRPRGGEGERDVPPRTGRPQRERERGTTESRREMVRERVMERRAKSNQRGRGERDTPKERDPRGAPPRPHGERERERERQRYEGMDPDAPASVSSQMAPFRSGEASRMATPVTREDRASRERERERGWDGRGEHPAQAEAGRGQDRASMGRGRASEGRQPYRGIPQPTRREYGSSRPSLSMSVDRYEDDMGEREERQERQERGAVQGFQARGAVPRVSGSYTPNAERDSGRDFQEVEREMERDRERERAGSVSVYGVEPDEADERDAALLAFKTAARQLHASHQTLEEPSDIGGERREKGRLGGERDRDFVDAYGVQSTPPTMRSVDVGSVAGEGHTAPASMSTLTATQAHPTWNRGGRGGEPLSPAPGTSTPPMHKTKSLGERERRIEAPPPPPAFPQLRYADLVTSVRSVVDSAVHSERDVTPREATSILTLFHQLVSRVTRFEREVEAWKGVAERERRSHQAQIESHTKERVRLETAHRARLAEANSFDSRLQHVRGLLRKSEEGVAALRAQAERVSSEKRLVSVELETTQGELATAQDQRLALTKRVDALRMEADTLRVRNEELAGRLTHLQERTQVFQQMGAPDDADTDWRDDHIKYLSSQVMKLSALLDDSKAALVQVTSAQGGEAHVQ